MSEDVVRASHINSMIGTFDSESNALRKIGDKALHTVLTDYRAQDVLTTTGYVQCRRKVLVEQGGVEVPTQVSPDCNYIAIDIEKDIEAYFYDVKGNTIKGTDNKEFSIIVRGQAITADNICRQVHSNIIGYSNIGEYSTRTKIRFFVPNDSVYLKYYIIIGDHSYSQGTYSGYTNLITNKEQSSFEGDYTGYYQSVRPYMPWGCCSYYTNGTHTLITGAGSSNFKQAPIVMQDASYNNGFQGMNTYLGNKTAVLYPMQSLMTWKPSSVATASDPNSGMDFTLVRTNKDGGGNHLDPTGISTTLCMTGEDSGAHLYQFSCFFKMNWKGSITDPQNKDFKYNLRVYLHGYETMYSSSTAQYDNYPTWIYSETDKDGNTVYHHDFPVLATGDEDTWVWKSFNTTIDMDTVEYLRITAVLNADSGTHGSKYATANLQNKRYANIDFLAIRRLS